MTIQTRTVKRYRFAEGGRYVKWRASEWMAMRDWAGSRLFDRFAVPVPDETEYRELPQPACCKPCSRWYFAHARDNLAREMLAEHRAGRDPMAVELPERIDDDDPSPICPAMAESRAESWNHYTSTIGIGMPWSGQ